MTKINSKELDEQLQSSGPLVANTDGNPTELQILKRMEIEGQIDGIAVKGAILPPTIVENGPWRVIEQNGKFMIASDDFTHDAALSLSGDFGSKEVKRAYAHEVAKALNSYSFSGSGFKTEDE